MPSHWGFAYSLPSVVVIIHVLVIATDLIPNIKGGSLSHTVLSFMAVILKAWSGVVSGYTEILSGVSMSPKLLFVIILRYYFTF